MPSRVLSSSGEFHHVTPSFQVCPSCRAFFRRSVQSRYNETFKCTKGVGDCEISQSPMPLVHLKVSLYRDWTDRRKKARQEGRTWKDGVTW